MEIIEYTDLSQPIYEKLKEMILNNELKPGEKILQEKISRQLGVSRTPLIKALQKLEYEYLVESIPRRGMFVKRVDLKEMIDVFECREALEGIAARSVAMHASDEEIGKLKLYFEPFDEKDNIDEEEYRKADEGFHELLVKLCGNNVLSKIYIYGHIHVLMVQVGLVRPPRETIKEHQNIIRALENRDAGMAETFTREHIKKSCDVLVEMKDKL